MSRIVLVVLVVLAVFSAGSSGQECWPNAEWTNCGSSCEPSCATPKSDFCIVDCLAGCRCKDGYLKNSQGACVSPGEC